MSERNENSKIKKIITVILLIIALLLLSLVSVIKNAYLWADSFIDDTLDYISYDESLEEWSGDDIDASDYGVEDNMGIDFSQFVDPEASRDESFADTSYPEYDESDGSGSGGGSHSYAPEPPEPPYEPNYEILEGLFDGDTVTEAYKKDVINILLIGADTISGKRARSDTMILMSINNIKKRIVFTSFMRDTYVSIPGYKNNRLNAAFSAGGPSLLFKTIKQNFDIDIDFYFTVSISSFEQAVDVIGGIDLDINENNYDYFKSRQELKGLSKDEAINGNHKVHLYGGTALGYARSRNFSNGDFTRTLHQRDLLTQFASNCKGKSLEELHALIKAVLPYVVTNMPKETLKSMIWNVLDYIPYTITDARVPCAGSFEYAKINGREVLRVNYEANEKYIKAKIYG